ncbi:C-X-C motif chemokine 11-1-like [Tachysurus fulvidraco]|uniref:C-X-C motif chemokine 11-1-like n=1 Tax=Tachysurus fulvidraco TaxID=1234273 RepID=UPI001FEF4C74|nr:C-X-C motif chemokine 11-1-like [Tachysurus fulvidraco]
MNITESEWISCSNLIRSEYRSKRKMKAAAVFLVFACLLILHVEGQARTNVRRCLCPGRRLNYIPPTNIDKIEIYPRSASCENVEMLAVLKNGKGKRCLNPESKFVRNNILKARLQKS